MKLLKQKNQQNNKFAPKGAFFVGKICFNLLKYLKKELSKNENYLFDYEINLQQQLKKEGISEDEIYNIQKNFRCLLLPFLDYLEKYQTYPGLAELLEV